MSLAGSQTSGEKLSRDSLNLTTESSRPISSPTPRGENADALLEEEIAQNEKRQRGSSAQPHGDVRRDSIGGGRVPVPMQLDAGQASMDNAATTEDDPNRPLQSTSMGATSPLEAGINRVHSFAHQIGDMDTSGEQTSGDTSGMNSWNNIYTCSPSAAGTDHPESRNLGFPPGLPTPDSKKIRTEYYNYAASDCGTPRDRSEPVSTPEPSRRRRASRSSVSSGPSSNAQALHEAQRKLQDAQRQIEELERRVREEAAEKNECRGEE